MQRALPDPSTACNPRGSRSPVLSRSTVHPPPPGCETGPRSSARAVRLALFDLDNTLLDGDSDLLWSELLAGDGALDAEPVRRWHADYHAGTLDIERFLRFQLE